LTADVPDEMIDGLSLTFTNGKYRRFHVLFDRRCQIIVDDTNPFIADFASSRGDSYALKNKRTLFCQ